MKSSSHKSWDSPASVGASKGPGTMPGAGELNHPGAGPGPASRRIRMTQPENPTSPAASSARPKGMKTYSEE